MLDMLIRTPLFCASDSHRSVLSISLLPSAQLDRNQYFKSSPDTLRGAFSAQYTPNSLNKVMQRLLYFADRLLIGRTWHYC